jgi:hypothetical protein
MKSWQKEQYGGVRRIIWQKFNLTDDYTAILYAKESMPGTVIPC